MRTGISEIPTLGLKAFVGVAAAFMLVACSKDSSPAGPGLRLSDKDLLAQGWRQFESQRFDSAAASFTGAYNETSNQEIRSESLEGRGWASMYRRDLLSAKSDFAAAMVLTLVSSTVVNDARVGASFTLYALNDFTNSASYAITALSDNPSYLFTHDSKVTAKRLRVLLVQSYFANGQFDLAAAQLDIVEPARAPHSADPTILLGSITGVLSSL